jgi:hypothetical protein
MRFEKFTRLPWVMSFTRPSRRHQLWAEHWHDDTKPFVWQKPAEVIIAKVTQGRASLASVNSATDNQ